MEYRTINDLVQATLEEGGVTVDPIFFTSPNHGYAVGGVVPSRQVPARAFYALDLLTFIHEHANVLFSGDYAIGTWLDHETDIVHLDVVEVIDNIDLALKTARNRDELAIFDLVAHEEIRV